MEEKKEFENVVEETQNVEVTEGGVASAVADTETPLDKNVRLMSPGRMLLRRFFRSKLSITGLIMLIALLVFCWVGPVVYQRWGEIETDYTG